MTREKAYKLRSMIVKASASLDDTDALAAVELFDEWQVDTDYSVDKRVRYGEKLYRCVQAHRSQADWTPGAAPALWTEVAEPGTGTRDNPVAYSGGMALERGRYYAQDGVTYLCTRDTVNPVYNDLKDLVGLYVEIVE